MNINGGSQMKRVLVLFLCLIMVVSFTACNSTPKEPEGTGDADGGAAESVTLKAAHSVAETHPYHLGLVKFKELVEERTDGKINIELYSNAVLGDERACIEGLQMGTLDIAVSSTGPLGNFEQDFLVLDLPYLFKDVTHARTVLDSPIGDELMASLDNIGIVGAAFWENGFRNVTNSKRPINALADMNGLKLRTMENEVHMAAFKTFGVDPTPMAWSEVFTSLQTGALDGQENPIAIIHAQQLNTVQDYLAITNHVYSPSALLISKITMSDLSEENQKILIEAAKEAGNYERELLSSMEVDQLKELEEAGMTITRPDLDEFIKTAQTIYANYENQFTEGLIDDILSMAK